LFSVAIRVEADDYHWGSCPKVEPVPDFDFEKVEKVLDVEKKPQKLCLDLFF